MNPNRKFHGKLLLFGEYTVVLGAKALVLPYPEVSGQWAFAQQVGDKIKAENSNKTLKQYLTWLENSTKVQGINLVRFANDIDQGLMFDSTIPIGYGVGSSGALVAALFDRYRLIPVPDDFVALRILLGHLENYFHGSSSGLDPLACYIGKPLLFADNKIEIQEHCPIPKGLHIRLHDTGITAATGPLVDYFKEQMKTYTFFKKVEQLLIDATDRAITSWLSGDTSRLWEAIRDISAFQLAHFQPMIPDNLRPMWQEGLIQGNHFMKLCGSGGGGYVMMFSKED